MMVYSIYYDVKYNTLKVYSIGASFGMPMLWYGNGIGTEISLAVG